jgi:hypothetical protein
MAAPNDGSRGSDSNLLWRRMGDRYLDSLKPEELRQIIVTLPPARRAADALHAQRKLLFEWCGKLRYPDRLSVTAMAEYLLAHFPRIHVHPDAPDLVAQLQKLDAQVLRVIDSPINRMRIKVGICPEDKCSGVVEAIVPHEAPPVIRCPACRKEWDSTQWTRLGARILRAA